MRIYISNFGKENWAWLDCLAHNTLAVMDDVRVHPYWLAKDQKGYVHEAKKYLKLSSGDAVISNVASRWYNVNTIFFETSGDIWIHRAKDELWWTTSLVGLPQGKIIDDPLPRNEDAKIYIYHKPCAPWSDRDKKGRPLKWEALHARAKEFLFTEGTVQQLSQDNAAYALALIEGSDLSSWHNRENWQARANRSMRFPVTYADARKKTLARIIGTMLATVKQSGRTYIETTKNKEFRFNNALDFEIYLNKIFDNQEGICALTGLNMLLDEHQGEAELHFSLDRIDSSKHYEPGNLQFVCKFANRWKSASNNDDFIQLIQLVRQSL